MGFAKGGIFLIPHSYLTKLHSYEFNEFNEEMSRKSTGGLMGGLREVLREVLKHSNG
jgi:hypothetical protein